MVAPSPSVEPVLTGHCGGDGGRCDARRKGAATLQSPSLPSVRSLYQTFDRAHQLRGCGRLAHDHCGAADFMNMRIAGVEQEGDAALLQSLAERCSVAVPETKSSTAADKSG